MERWLKERKAHPLKEPTRIHPSKATKEGTAKHLELDETLFVESEHRRKETDLIYERGLVQAKVNLPPIEINATEDAYVINSDYSEVQFGLDDYLFAHKTLDYVAKTLVKFNLSGVNITPSSTAVLQLYVNIARDDVHNVTVSRLDDEDWEEATVSWSSLNTTQVTKGQDLLITGKNVKSWVEFGVSDLLESSQSTITFLLEYTGPPGNEHFIYFGSTEGDQHPKLLLWLTTVPSMLPSTTMKPSTTASPSILPSARSSTSPSAALPTAAPSISAAPSTTPILCQTKPLLSTADNTLFSIIQGVSASDTLLDTHSAQYKAACWLIYEDRGVVGDTTQASVAQRYILALLYFSTGGPGWYNQYYFLAKGAECDWNIGLGVLCEDRAITKIELGE